MHESKFTINELLVLMKTVRYRMKELESLRDQISTKTTFGWGGETAKVVEPQYDVKKVDAKMVELQKFMFFADSKIKNSNAVTKVDFDADIDSLLSNIE